MSPYRLLCYGLVGTAAREHKLSLVTCGRRAESTRRALRVTDELLAPVNK